MANMAVMKNRQLEQHPHWTNLKSIVALTAERELKGKEARYFITSLDATNPQYLGHIIRAHLGIKNKHLGILNT